MRACPTCSGEVTAGDVWCPKCGGVVPAATTRLGSGEHAIAVPAGSLTPAMRTVDGRFVPGTLLARRYRLVTLIGSGGMGEVYQADDLKLDQPVALKFLPSTLALSAGALARFHAEARIARQVSHPNVCRVYDIGDVDGLHFLTMELIDGENLASLLRQIGRLPADKAVEIARQICAGLAAAHDAGVLHRDLKPANVMIDGRGRARITDFGIAAIARDVRRPDAVAGTPAYMAPEQLLGQEATARSDIYALGLVLYELFTGKRAVEVRTVAEALLLHASESTPTPPSTWVPDLDPVVERAILRCLEKEPALRPASPIQVAAALPGGDPLHAALAAGETPSPEMVAAAGSVGVIRPAVALPILAATIAALLVSAGISDRTFMVGRLSLPLSPDVLAYKAREIFTRLGYTDAPADSAYGFDYHGPYIAYTGREGLFDRRWQQLSKGRPAAVHFWYRESPEPLEVTVRARRVGRPQLGPVEVDEPQSTLPGMRHVLLDPQGRLVALHTVPLARDQASPGSTPNWAAAFAAAELDLNRFEPAAPTWTPLVAFDAQAAWTGTYPEQPDLPIRIEAAAFRGQLIAFQMFGPWSSVASASAAGRPVFTPISIAVALLFVGVIAVATVLAWTNIRAGRGDRRGALRLAFFFFALQLLVWLLRTDHVAGAGEGTLLYLGAGHALLSAATMYVLYLALEPFVRRRWPQVLIAWSRVVAGRWRDPLVGRDVLAGVALGVLAFLIRVIVLGSVSAAVQSKSLDAVLSVRRVAGLFTGQLTDAIATALFVCLELILLRTLLRNTWLAGGVLVLLFVGLQPSPASPDPLIATMLSAVVGVLLVVSITRFGLVAAVAMWFVGILIRAPTTLDVTSWYAAVSLFTLATIVGIAGYACVIAMGGLPSSSRAAPTP